MAGVSRADSRDTLLSAVVADAGGALVPRVPSDWSSTSTAEWRHFIGECTVRKTNTAEDIITKHIYCT